MIGPRTVRALKKMSNGTGGGSFRSATPVSLISRPSHRMAAPPFESEPETPADLTEYDVLTISGSATGGPHTVGTLGDGRPGFAIVSMIGHREIITSTPGWTVVNYNANNEHSVYAYCFFDGVTDDPDSYDPIFDHDVSLFSGTPPGDYETLTWAGVAVLFDDPIARVTDFTASGGASSNVGSVVTIYNSGVTIYDAVGSFQCWVASGHRKGTTGTISAVADSPLPTAISASDNSVTVTGIEGEWVAAISLEEADNHTSNRTFTITLPSGSGIGAGVRIGRHVFFGAE